MIEKSHSLLMLLVVLVIGLVAGFFISQLLVVGPVSQLNAQLSNMQTQLAATQTQVTNLQSQVLILNAELKNANLDFSSKASVFDTQLHDLMQEHNNLLVTTIRRSLFSDPAYNATYTTLLTNIDDISDKVAFVYGQPPADQFKALWIKKLNAFLNYTYTLNNNNSVSNVNFARNMADYENESVVFWVTVSNGIIDKRTIANDVVAHVTMVRQAVDYWNIGDYYNYYISLHNSYAQMGAFADDLAAGMIKQHPELFS